MSMLFFSGVFLLQAEEVKQQTAKTHKHRKAKFSLSYPGDWLEKTDEAGVALSVAAPDGNAAAPTTATDTLPNAGAAPTR